jgi:multidrug resistance efflux pump
VVSTHVWETLKADVTQETQALAKSVRDVLANEPALEASELDKVRRERLRHDGVVSDETVNRLTAEVDSRLLGDDARAANGTNAPQPVDE